MRDHFVRNRIRVWRYAFVMLIISFVGVGIGRAQTVKDQKEQRKVTDDVSLALVSQRKLMPEPPCDNTRKGCDVFVVAGKGDDLLVRFLLTNRSGEGVYYLRSIYDKTPYGYVLYKQTGDDDWKATSPDRGRKGSKGGGYEWQLLAPGSSVEFEFSDLSTRPGEHAVSVLINTQPDYPDLVEIVSGSYRPMAVAAAK